MLNGYSGPITFTFNRCHAKALTRFPVIRGGVIALETRPEISIVRFSNFADLNQAAFQDVAIPELERNLVLVKEGAGEIYPELAEFVGSEVRFCNDDSTQISSVAALELSWNNHIRNVARKIERVDASTRTFLKLVDEPFLVVLPFDQVKLAHKLRWEAGLVSSRAKGAKEDDAELGGASKKPAKQKVKASNRGGPRFGIAAGKRDIWPDGPIIWEEGRVYSEKKEKFTQGLGQRLSDLEGFIRLEEVAAQNLEGFLKRVPNEDRGVQECKLCDEYPDAMSQEVEVRHPFQLPNIT